MLSSYAKREWLTVLAIGLMVSITLMLTSWWWAALLVLALTGAVLSFFRDPDRIVPTHRGVMVSPGDGQISSIHEVEHYEPFNEPAVCVRIFLSLLDVHVARSPCHGVVQSVTHRPGKHLNAMNPESAEVNASTLVVLVHPVTQKPLATVRLVAGLIARTIVCAAAEGDMLQRGQRMGIIKLGSTAELYLPASSQPQVLVQQGDRVKGAETILAQVRTPAAKPLEQMTECNGDETTPQQAEQSEEVNAAPAELGSSN